MPIYELEGVAPRIDVDAFIHPDAVVIGDVVVGPESSIWPSAVFRGDYGTITVGTGSSIQDGSVVHAGPGFPTIIGDGCVVGHLTHLEGCTLEDESLAGSGAWDSIGRDEPWGDGWRERGGAESHGRSTRRWPWAYRPRSSRAGRTCR